MKLKEYLKAASIDGDFGIEIEVEGENLPTIRSNNWHTEKDGSLRGESNEYIITKPIKIDEVREAIEYLNKRLDKSVLNFSFRTSVHIHMNMLECTHEEILNTVYTYLLIEEPLIKFCGKERKANRFCLRLQDADGIIDTLSMLFSGDIKSYGNIRHDSIRYASINLEALVKYGSLEFRGMRGTVDPDIIENWVTAIYNIREFAKKYKNPVEIYEVYSHASYRDFLSLVLLDKAPEFIYPKLDRDMQKSFSLSLDLPFAYKNKKEKKSYEPLFNLDLGLREPVARLPQRVYDHLGNILVVGFFVRVAKQDKDHPVGWVNEMTRVFEEQSYHRISYIDFDRNWVELEGLECQYPAECLEYVEVLEEEDEVDLD